MAKSKAEILKDVAEYILEKKAAKTWTPGVDWVQYAGAYFDDKEYIGAIGSLLNEWLVLGEDAMKFESKFPPLLGKKHGVVVNSGSSANLIMVLTAKRYFKWEDGTKVIVPVAGFPTTVNPIIQAKLTPVFVDVELSTLNLNLDDVEAAIIETGARILMFAHVLGNPPDMSRIRALKEKYNLIILEDCCDALGSTYDGKPVGTDAELATCSFYPAHHMTMGEGGFVACSNDIQEKIARSIREWGRGCFCVGKKANLSTKGSCGCRFSAWIPALPDEIFDHKYVYDNIGYNLKPIELQCSMGLAQLDKLPEIHAKRKANHRRLSQIFNPYEQYFHIHGANLLADPSWFAFPITVRDSAPFKRSDLTTFLEGNKIQTRNYFGGNILLQPAYKGVEFYDYDDSHFEDGVDATQEDDAEIIKDTYPVATKVTTDTLFLGTSPVITEKQLDYVEQKVNEFFQNK
jgi:CDP-4-dehydro-6-deoxyglucose reductase, E1